jgi:plasmid stabilization system protein ParE
MLIKWSYSAEKDLEIIFQFYQKTSNNKVAKQIVNDIIYTSNSLKLGLYLGQIEPLLSHYEEGFRYLISNHN